MTQITDSFNRPLRDLRISVTDRCNFRCTYCMPKDIFGPNYQYAPRADLLSYEEIETVVKAFTALGVRKIRLTGGEPLIRRDLEHLIEKLAKLQGIEDISLTSNASLLTKARAKALKNAGLNRLNVSLDALDDKTFMEINDVNFPVQKVLDGIDNASQANFDTIKINMVVKRGVNEHSILPLAEFFKGTGHILRFIEYMDVGTSNGWQLQDVFSVQEIVELINSRFPIHPVDANYKGEVAKRWQYKDKSGEIGIISSVSQPFCGDCTRARISAQGMLYTCLFATEGTDLREKIRANPSMEQLQTELIRLWRNRSDRYSEIRGEQTVALPKIEMSYIGG